MRNKQTKNLLILYLAALLLLLPAAFYTYKHPEYNFDMVGYMALIIKMDQKGSVEEIHKATYSELRRSLSADEYSRLTETAPHRKKFEADYSEFEKVLPNYIVKPLYLWTCWLFYKSGISLVTSTVLPSIISFLFLGLLLFHWLSKYLNAVIALTGTTLIMNSTFVTWIARLSTPDLLSSVFLLASFYFILEKRNPLWMFVLFLLAILSRADNVILCFFIILFLTFSKKWKTLNLKQFFAMSASFAITYLFIVLPVRQFGWSIFFYSEYVKHIDYSRDFDQPITLISHLSYMYRKLLSAFISSHFTLFAFLGLLVFNRNVSLKDLSFDQTFLLLLSSVCVLKFLLLPDISDRFYIGFYLTIIILLIRKFFPKISTSTL